MRTTAGAPLMRRCEPGDLLQPHRPVLPARPLARLRDPQRLQGLAPVARAAALAAHEPYEGVQLRLVRGGEPLQQPGQGRRGGPLGSRRDRGAVVEAHELVAFPASSMRTPWPAPLQRVAVDVTSVPSSRVSRAAAVTTVPGLPEHRRPRVRAFHGVDLRHLAARHPPHHVEVVHQAVPVEPAGDRQVRGRRRRRVGRQGPYGVQPPQASRPHRLTGRGVPGVEPAHEADLQRRTGLRDRVQGRAACCPGRGRSASRRRRAGRRATRG